jgi:hypothetical protein
MSTRANWVHGFVVFATALSMTACADRGDMSTENRSTTGDAAGENRSTSMSSQGERQPMRVTGCFQEMSGFDNFVLSNVGDAAGASPGSTRAYRIEQRGEYEQYVGKQVTVSGRVDSDAATGGMPAGKAASGDVDFNDLPELHVESVSVVSENCGNPRK